MFEVILGAVGLGVLAVEIIEVRQKCEESYPGMWQDARAFHLEIPVREDEEEFDGAPSAQRFHPGSASPAGLPGEAGGRGWCAPERGRAPR
jgi:hypothetical protein